VEEVKQLFSAEVFY